jgi:subtilisin family serine protease
MAGDIAAHGHGSNSGALGIAPSAKILPIADTDNTGHVTDEAMVAGIEYATQHGAAIISISQGGVAATVDLVNAVRAAEESNIVIVAAAGNEADGDLSVASPAKLPGVIAAGAVDRHGSHLADSVSGPAVLLAAPGEDILSPSPNGGYIKGTGTSDAAAIIAGAAALVRSKYPNLSAAEVIHRLTSTAVDKGAPGRDPQYGYGVINIVAALTADVPPLSASTSPTTSGADQPANHDSRAAQRPAKEAPIVALVIVVTVVVLAAFAIVGWRLARRVPRD